MNNLYEIIKKICHANMKMVAISSDYLASIPLGKLDFVQVTNCTNAGVVLGCRF